MNEIYDGVITKPELNEETLTHYGIAKKVHKYIDKYLKYLEFERKLSINTAIQMLLLLNFLLNQE